MRGPSSRRSFWQWSGTALATRGSRFGSHEGSTGGGWAAVASSGPLLREPPPAQGYKYWARGDVVDAHAARVPAVQVEKVPPCQFLDRVLDTPVVL